MLSTVAEQRASPDSQEALSKPANAQAVSLLRIAVWIAETIDEHPLLYVAEDDIRASWLAQALRALRPDACVLHLPASDALPGEDAPASPANAGTRVAALSALYAHTKDDHAMPIVCITSAEATAQLYAMPMAFDLKPPVLALDDTLNLATFETLCVELGYVVDDRVDEPGEIAVRGTVADIFPVDQSLPVRVEIEDGRIAALRTYDPADQRTIGELNEIAIGRASEPEMGKGCTLVAHLNDDFAIVEEPKVPSRRKAFLELAKDAARFGRAKIAVADEARWLSDAKALRRLDWTGEAASPLSRFVEAKAPLAALAKAARPLLDAGGRLVLIGSERDLRFLQARLGKRLKADFETVTSWPDMARQRKTSLFAIEAPADAGFTIDDMIVVAAADILGSRAIVDLDAASNGATTLTGTADLHIGDIVVHEDHGLARLDAIETEAANDGNGDAADLIALEFAGGTRRLVPVFEASRIWRYGGDANAVTLDKLDGSSWKKRREEIDVALAETAAALVKLSIEREARTLTPVQPDPARYEQFANGFGYTETPDQARAIAAVRDDLASGIPMDRLVIGDVGFGKTEVALRAAAMVALAGGQVAVAAPTTVLVRQHLALFERRFGPMGITVAGLSRLSSAAEKKRVKAGLADGTIAVVVGTAAVAGKDVRYADLKLVVIDEEQRFGAADKTKLRGLHDGHVLTLSATPIPRTLQSALIGLQQMSVIATPPARRQPIPTVIDSWDDAVVRAALLRERARRGQSFVVVPRIEDMAGVAARLCKAFPEGEIIEAHGKMPADELDTAMTDFAAGRGDVLLATNIIEAGLDVPRANTMIVWRADRFGLSQLHQLRGRVGRGSRRGHILLLTEDETQISPATLKRLRTLQAFDRLGAGFAISAQDLDMRGAGDLLGDSQTGHMRLIGIDLYQHLLSQALRTARGETVDEWQPDLRLGIVGAFPGDWLPEDDLRLQLYARLARLATATDLDAFEDELVDRFGALPPPALALVEVARVRLLALSAGVERIDAGPAAIAFTPRPEIDTKSWSGTGLTASNGRFLAKDAIDDARLRGERIVDILESLI